MGGNAFCFKVCNPASPRAAELCQHIYDRIGCTYNAPNQAKDNVFEVCEGETQDPPGVYTGPDGQTSTYTQPGEGIVPTPESTYTPRMPASSNCVTYASSELYPAASGAPASPSGSNSGSASGAAPTGSGSASGSGPRPSGSAGASNAGSTGGDDDGAFALAAMWGLSAICIVATSFALA